MLGGVAEWPQGGLVVLDALPGVERWEQQLAGLGPGVSPQLMGAGLRAAVLDPVVGDAGPVGDVLRGQPEVLGVALAQHPGGGVFRVEPLHDQGEPRGVAGHKALGEGLAQEVERLFPLRLRVGVPDVERVVHPDHVGAEPSS